MRLEEIASAAATGRASPNLLGYRRPSTWTRLSSGFSGAPCGWSVPEGRHLADVRWPFDFATATFRCRSSTRTEETR